MTKGSVALMQDSAASLDSDYLQVKHLRVVCGSDQSQT